MTNALRPIRTLLIANRGEIACAVIETARVMGMRTVAVASDVDARSRHVRMADAALRIGRARAAESYLNIAAILDAAQRAGADAIHPGYGFLSENAAFAEAVLAAGLKWVGPPPAAMRAMGQKDAAKRLMEKAGVPVVPGYHGEAQEIVLLAGKASEIGYPVLIKAAAGGGGRGMRLVEKAGDFREALASAKREAKAAFGDDRVLVEKFIANPRHIEVQVFGDAHGGLVHLFERDCSLQRRHQKVIEEAPAPGMTQAVRAAMTEAALKAARAIGYQGAGTVEFIVDGSGPLCADGFWFMEMNTRLQVEHRVTQAVTGVNLIEWQLRVAQGEALPLAQDAITLSGHAVEARLYAEDPANGFAPSAGTLQAFHVPQGAHLLDTGFDPGDAVPPHYDAMLAKLVAHGATRADAFGALHHALAATRIAGIKANAGFLAALTAQEDVLAGRIDTGLIARHMPALGRPPALDAAIIAEAAIMAAGLAPVAADATDPWAVLRAFTLYGPRADAVSLVHDGVTIQAGIIAAADCAYVEVNGETNRVALKAGAEAASWSGHVAVFRRGHALEFQLPDPSEASAAAVRQTVDAILSPMPGLVKSVRVKAGDAVEGGTLLLLLEAMKMEHAITAPHGGVIAEIIADGRQVSQGAVLVRFAGAN